MTNLVFILGDQLFLTMSSLPNFNKQKDFVLMAEVASEANYVWHHKKRLEGAAYVADAAWIMDATNSKQATNLRITHRGIGRLAQLNRWISKHARQIMLI